MNRILLMGLATVSIYNCAAYAEMNPNDVSAALNVTGTVSQSMSSCAVDLSRDTVQLYSKISHLPAQGTKQLVTDFVRLSVSGPQSCNQLIAQGKMAYKFIGDADDADGTSLANNNLNDDAAKGVGIALYQVAGDVIPINSGMILATFDGGNLGVGLVKLNGQTPSAGSVTGSLTIQIERL